MDPIYLKCFLKFLLSCYLFAKILAFKKSISETSRKAFCSWRDLNCEGPWIKESMKTEKSKKKDWTKLSKNVWNFRNFIVVLWLLDKASSCHLIQNFSICFFFFFFFCNFTAVGVNALTFKDVTILEASYWDILNLFDILLSALCSCEFIGDFGICHFLFFVLSA